MALFKSIRQPDGVTTSYHRISSVTTTVNKQNFIAVFSYVDEEARKCENSDESMQPYVKSITYGTAYDENMTVMDAYNYLKTLPQFEGAADA